MNEAAILGKHGPKTHYCIATGLMDDLLCFPCIKALLLAQFRDEAEAAGKLLPARHPVSRAVREVGLRIAAVAQEDVDGQPIQHMKVQHLCMTLSRS